MLTGQLGFFDCLNILGCHVVCGSIALVYPVLGGAIASIRSYYPALVARSPGETNDAAELAKLAAATANIVPLAGFIPVFGLLWLALGLDNLEGTPRAVATGFVGIAGLVAIPAAYAMSQMIQADLAALIRATSDGRTELDDAGS